MPVVNVAALAAELPNPAVHGMDSGSDSRCQLVVGAALGELLGALVGAVVGALLGGSKPGSGALFGVAGRQAGGNNPALLPPHQPRLVAPALSTELSYVQSDPGQSCWQYPHGTKSHDAHPLTPVGAAVTGVGPSTVTANF